MDWSLNMYTFINLVRRKILICNFEQKSSYILYIYLYIFIHIIDRTSFIKKKEKNKEKLNWQNIINVLLSLMFYLKPFWIINRLLMRFLKLNVSFINIVLKNIKKYQIFK